MYQKESTKNEDVRKEPHQISPYPVHTKEYGKVAQDPIPKDNTKELSKNKKKQVQQVVRSTMSYALTVDITILMALSTVSAEQSKVTEFTMDKIEQLVEY